jgi:acyl-CoA reductase-like NAD-dependent aldehyde dehydrogenase
MTQQSIRTVVDFDGHYASIVNGAAVTSPTTARVYNPATREVIAEVPVTTLAQLDEAVAAARAAFLAWSAIPVAERQAIVTAIGDRREARAEEFIALLTQASPGRGGLEGLRRWRARWCRTRTRCSGCPAPP